MRYSEETVEEVRQRTDIVDLISSYVSLKKRGATHMGLCPFHNEKTPSFAVSSQRQFYYCFGCGAGGNAISFVMQYENMTFKESIKYLADRAGMTIESIDDDGSRQSMELRDTIYKLNNLAAHFYYEKLISDDGVLGRRYFEARGLSARLVKHFGLGYASQKKAELYEYLKDKGYDDKVIAMSGLVIIEERGARDKFFNRVMFPILDQNSRVIGFGGRVLGDGMPKYLNSPETPIFDKSRNLYGLNFAKKSRQSYFLLCEGYMDVIALHGAGYTNAIASLGTALTQGHCTLIKRYVSEVILTYDSDTAGSNAMKRAFPLLRQAGLRAKVIDMSPYKDPDEFIKNLGSEAYAERIRNARNAFLWLVDKTARDYDLNDPHSKTDFFKDIADKLTIFEDPVERNNYIDTISKDYGISVQNLKEYVRKFSDSNMVKSQSDEMRARDKEFTSKKREDANTKTQIELLSLLMNDATHINDVKKYISVDDMSDELCKEVLSRLYEGKEIATIITEFMSDEQKEKRLSSWLKNIGREDIDDYKRALSDIIRKIKIQKINAMLDDESLDVQQMQDLLNEKKKWSSVVFT